MAQSRNGRARSQPNAPMRISKVVGPSRPGKTFRAAAAPRIIETDDDVREGVRALRRKCAIMRHVHDTAGHPPLRRRPAGFEGLARVIVGQQLSVASATAIWT